MTAMQEDNGIAVFDELSAFSYSDISELSVKTVSFRQELLRTDVNTKKRRS